MNCFHKISYHNASSDLRKFYDTILQTLQLEQLPNWASYLGSNLSALNLVWNTYQNIYQEGNVSILLKELILFSVSRAKISPYCT